MKKLLGIIILGLLLSSNAYSECIEDTLKKNIERGRYLLTTSGKLYDVLAGDNFNAMLWLSYSNLVICGPKEIIYKETNRIIKEIIPKIEKSNYRSLIIS